MSTEYDSTKIRRLAAQLERTSVAVNNVKQTSLRSARQEMTGNFQGEAAEALEQSISELTDDVTTLASHLGSISKALFRLAAQVEAADEKAKALIGAK